ncbi:RAB, putative [Perkinsus marinus ATCC 50983]|nr:RAB, putative [Perkinsus marinus ATCC 50983]EER01516.1 RAB, putative [Perkinsus marinus ATCC 50983]|eukprot:XP_002768798.1 RAB, putative [Perkinsus marinus ATCC 50983]
MGAEAVGKSCIVKRYCEGRFIKRYISTIGIDYGTKTIKYSGEGKSHIMKINLFDMAGHDEFRDIRIEFYDNTQSGLLVYDVTSMASFRALDGWLNELITIRECNSKIGRDKIPIILVANKIDVEALRVVTREQGEDYAAQNGMKYFETSANTGEGIQEAFLYLFTRLLSTCYH